MIAGNVFGVNLAIKPVQAAGNDRITQRRGLPLDPMPLVRAFAGELVGKPNLFTRKDIDRESARLANSRVAGRTGHDAERHQRRAHRHAMERLASEANRCAIDE
ncbi:hypothetical protein D3C76_1523190 [compost metagenome]